MIIGRTSPNAVFSGQDFGELSPGLVLTSDSEILPGYGEIPTTFPPSNSLPVAAVGRALSCSPAAQAHIVVSPIKPSLPGAAAGVRVRGSPDIPPNNARPVVKQLLPLQKLTPGYGSAHAAGDVEGKHTFKHTCDDVKFMILCPDNPKHHKILAKYNCHRPGCPICWPGWGSKASKDAAARIEGYRDAHGMKRDSRHISFMPPPGTITELQDLLDQTNRVMKQFGIEAAAAIPHPYRLAKGDDDGHRDLKSRANRYREALDSPDWRNNVVFAPHVHAMVYGPLPDIEVFTKMTGGWIYKNHEKGKGSRGRRGDELEATIYYLLTHAWAAGNNAIVRYWFGMSTRKLGKNPGEPYFEIDKCPECGVDCVKVPPDIVQFDRTVVHVYQDLHNAPLATRKIKTWTFFVRSASTPKVSAKSRSIWGPGGCPAGQAVLGGGVDVL